MVLKSFLCLTFFFSLMPRAKAFVLLSGPAEARLNVSEAVPEVNFILSPNPPTIKDKDEFAGGQYQDLDDAAFWFVLVEEAMQKWNDVNGAFITLSVSFSDEARLDVEDGLHSIVASPTNYTSSAYAKPQVLGSVIEDCDIAVSERGSSAKSLAYTILHELGHCLGLGHNHSDYKAVMSYSREDRSLRLGLDDEAALIFLYPEASVGSARELIHCGTLGLASRGSGAGLVWLYLIPLLGGLWRLYRGKASG